MKQLTREALARRRTITISDLLAKAENEDWHGVQDCASDIREIESQLAILDSMSSAPPTETRKDGKTDWVFGDPKPVDASMMDS